jgi:hypothetical protein
MTPDLDERLVQAFEDIAGQLSTIAQVLELRFQCDYPRPKPVRDADISHVPSPEEQLREDQGQTGEPTTEDWTSLGPREKAFIESSRQTQRDSSRSG